MKMIGRRIIFSQGYHSIKYGKYNYALMKAVIIDTYKNMYLIEVNLEDSKKYYMDDKYKSKTDIPGRIMEISWSSVRDIDRESDSNNLDTLLK